MTNDNRNPAGLSVDQRHAFDFYTGTWQVMNRRLTKVLAGGDEWDEFPGLSQSRMVLDGTANFDEISFPTKGYTGLTLRLYDEARDEWSLYWASSRTGAPMDPPVVGRFSAPGFGEFFCDDVFEGRDVRVRYTWSGTDTPTPHWEQAFQLAGQTEWETNWIMDSHRDGGGTAAS
jgi:hypothetical protein